MEEQNKKQEIEPSIFKIWICVFVVGALVALMLGCASVPKTATITEKRDTAINFITDRSFAVADSFKLKLDSFGIREFGFLNVPIERISGREIVHDSIKLTYNFKKNIITADYKTRPDTNSTITIQRDKSETVMAPRPWGEIFVYLLVGFAFAALIVGFAYGWKKWR